MNTATVRLTPAQLEFARALIQTHTSMGDCRLHGYTLSFDDYEGAAAFRNKVFGLGTRTTRAYITMNAIIDKLDAAITAAVGRSGHV